jgi:hypothetical protein
MDPVLMLRLEAWRKASADLMDSIEAVCAPPPKPVPKPMSAEDLIEVRPTGANGKNVVHLWPTPHPEITGENALGYAMRCAQMIDPATGAPYFPVNVLGALMLGVGSQPGDNLAMALDRWLYPEFWWDQAEVDRRAEIARAQAASGGWAAMDAAYQDPNRHNAPQRTETPTTGPEVEIPIVPENS